MTPYSWRFYRHESTWELILSWVNIFPRKSIKVPGKLSFTQQSEPAIRRKFHRDISLIIYYMLPFLSNKPSCVVPIIFTTIYLPFLLFDILCILELIHSLHVLCNNQKKFWGCSMLFLLEGLQSQNVLIMLLFSMKQSYQLTKTTPDVNNSLWFLHGMKELL